MNSQYSIAAEFQLFLESDSAQKTPRGAKADAYFLGVALHFMNKVRQLEYIDQVRLEDLQILQRWLSEPQQIGLAKKEAWSDTTVEYYTRIIKKFFRKMHATDRIAKNPCAIWKVPRGTAEVRRPMSLQEFEQIYAASPEWFRPILTFLRMTGSRGASVAALTWADVDFKSRIVILRSRKGGLKQTKLIPIPMYPALYDFLYKAVLDVQDFERPPLTSDPVFWGPRGIAVTAQEITSEGSRLIKKLGLKGVVLYGLRHAVGAEMTAAGIPLEITRQAMGHSSVTQTSHYAKGIASSVVSEAFARIRGEIKKK